MTKTQKSGIETGLICVTLGLALNDKTWKEQDIKFRLGLEWESWGSTFDLADKAMDNFCDQAVKDRDKKTAYEIAEAAGKIRNAYAGFFLLSWNWEENNE